MLLCTDVDYRIDGTARAAGILFSGWTDSVPVQELVCRIDHAQPYEPGQFFRRELPCVQAVYALAKAAASPVAVSLVVVDGYVTLDTAGRAGLGLYLYEALGRRVPVVGVAKTAYQGLAHALAVRRGHSQAPLSVTAVGIDVQSAARGVGEMAGPHRMPTLLRRADQLCRRAV